MKIQRSADMPRGSGQEGKSSRGRFSILVGARVEFFKVLKCASILIVRERERNLRAAASPPMSTWLRPRVSRRRATTTCLVSTKNKQLAIFDNGFKFRAKYVYQVDNYFSVTPKYYCWEFLHLWRFISTKGALRLPTTYNNHPIPSYPTHPTHPQSLLNHLNRPWIDLSRPPMPSNDY